MDEKKEERVSQLIKDAVEELFGWNRNSILKSDVSTGNINYIYRVQNSETGDSFIFKFADDETRIRPDGYLSPERNAHEGACLQWYARCEPSFVPRVYHVDEKNNFIVMEDLKGSMTLREALMRNISHKNLGATVASLLVEISFPLLDIIRKDKTEDLPCWNTASDDLIELTERLVFEDPYYNRRGNNIYTKENEEFIKEQLDDDDLLEVVEILKKRFKTCKQTLIHGDMHTGSFLVLTGKDQIKNKIYMEDFSDLYVIDPEFAFYGPVAYDIGNVIAHLFFAQAFQVYNARHKMKAHLLLDQYREILESFVRFIRICAIEKLEKILKDTPTDDDMFVEKYVRNMLEESMRYAGCEIIRRIVGSAKVPELTQLLSRTNRMLMEQALINTAVQMVKYATDRNSPGGGLIISLPEWE